MKHRVLQGECLATIAARYGFHWKTIWEHPENAALRKARTSPTVLQPDDEVFVPKRKRASITVTTGSCQKFVAKLPPVKLHLRMVINGEPIKQRAYELEVGGRTLTGETDGEGKIVVSIPAAAMRARLKLKERREEIELLIGHLDPATASSGQQARLRNLGHYREEIDGQLSEEFAEAVAEFQSVHGLEPTGEVDKSTSDKIFEIYGC